MYDYENDYNEAKQELERNEAAYNAAAREANRLRGVAREYGYFYGKVKEAYDNQDWDAIKKLFEELDD